MKKKITTVALGILLYVTVGNCGPNGAAFTAVNPLAGEGLQIPTPYQQRLANEQYQQQQILLAAQNAAAQAADYAKQAAVYNNQAARQVAEYAAQAADHAKQAAYEAAYPLHIFNGQPTSIEEDAAYAEQAAASAKQALVQAEVDSVVTKLENERDEAITNLKAKSAPNIADLELQISTLKEKAAQLESQRSESERANDHLRAKQLFQPQDPWRLLDGKFYSAKDVSWLHFTGTVLEVKPNGILVHGDFGPPLEAGFGERDYFVENFPIQAYPLADGETITSPMNFVAHMDVKSSIYQYTNTTIDLRANTVRRLDYGEIVNSPPPDLANRWNNIPIIGGADPELSKKIDENQKEQSAIELQLTQVNDDFEKAISPILAEYDAKIKDVPNVLAKQAKEKADAKKQAVEDKVLKFNQDAADNGDAYGLLRMGERCRDGEGVPKDLTKARDYLTKAASAGSPSAVDELESLNKDAK